MRRAKTCLLWAVAAGCLSLARAEFDGGDDFDDNSVNTSKWLLPDTTFDGGTLTETGSRLRYTTTGAVLFQSQATRFWKLNLGSYTNDWFVQVDANNPFTSADANQTVDVRLRIFNAADNPTDRVELQLRFDGPTNRYFRAEARDDNSTLATNAPTTATAAGLRLRWSASNLVLHAEYDGDAAAGGYQWTNLASFKLTVNPVNWNLGSTSLFECAVAGFSSFVSLPSGSNVFLDNFRAVSAPLIATNPTSQNAVQGSNVTFAVAATGSATLAYQWQFNSNNLAGETNALLTLANVQPSQAGAYRCVVTNEAGARASANATLSVTALPALAYSRTGTNFILSWPANATGFVLQATAALFPPQWTNATPAPVTVGTNKVVNNNLTGAEKFYRLFKP
jgi:hypothetical protein